MAIPVGTILCLGLLGLAVIILSVATVAVAFCNVGNVDDRPNLQVRIPRACSQSGERSVATVL